MDRIKRTVSVLMAVLLIGSCFGMIAFAEDGEHVHAYTSTPVLATCTEQGYTVFVCSCGDMYKDLYTDPLGHNYGGWDAVQQCTCVTEGVMERTCKRCGAKQTQTVPVMDHRDSNADGKCDTCDLVMEPEEVFSPFEWFISLFRTIFERIRNFFASFGK